MFQNVPGMINIVVNKSCCCIAVVVLKHKFKFRRTTEMNENIESTVDFERIKPKVLIVFTASVLPSSQFWQMPVASYK